MHLGVLTMVRAKNGGTSTPTYSAPTPVYRAPAPAPTSIYRAPAIIPHTTATHLQPRASNGSASVIDALTSAPDAIAPGAPPVSYETISQGVNAAAGGQEGGDISQTVTVAPEKKSMFPILAALAAAYFLG